MSYTVESMGARLAESTRPCVSVVVPTYNRAPLLLETLDSLRAQPYRPLEIIIVNDGSTDDTELCVQQWIASLTNDEELRCCFYSRVNTGASASRNFGKLQATGKYIHFLDSDDLVGCHFYTVLVAVMETAPTCAFVWGEWLSAEDAQEALKHLPTPAQMHPIPSLAPPNNAWCGIFRTALMPNELKWNETLKNHNDWKYTTRFLLTEPSLILQVPVPLLVYRMHSGEERLGRIRNPESLRLALNATVMMAGAIRTNSRYIHAVRLRFSTEYITLLFDTLQIGCRSLQFQAARGVLKHATFRQSWFWNLIALILLGLLPFAGVVRCAWVLKRIRRHFGDMQLTTSAE